MLADGLALRDLLGMRAFDATAAWGPVPLLLIQSPKHRSQLATVNTPNPNSTGAIDASRVLLDAYVSPDTVVAPIIKSDRNPFAGTITVGRAKVNDICIHSEHVSKVHAWFVVPEPASGPWRLLDHQSRNGTSVNGTELTPGELVYLRPSDQIIFGTTLTLYVDAPMLQNILEFARESWPGVADHAIDQQTLAQLLSRKDPP